MKIIVLLVHELGIMETYSISCAIALKRKPLQQSCCSFDHIIIYLPLVKNTLSIKNAAAGSHFTTIETFVQEKQILIAGCAESNIRDLEIKEL